MSVPLMKSCAGISKKTSNISKPHFFKPFQRHKYSFSLVFKASENKLFFFCGEQDIYIHHMLLNFCKLFLYEIKLFKDFFINFFPGHPNHYL
ncbi:predicted protein [Methanosarcina acetivorans C2A]|uniref:Uncharacterized protein n=1 Tax=Methanosarcina acetivorans (strain ATCC 35395 / DSM 2834 / JCM 12185 / C2A) TaxID=188937 RepID=Q8TKJ3_METAC|nr:predicted protein [Methanosarcina acetivorans C2A]